MDLEKMKRAKKEAKRELSEISGVQGIGVGDGFLKIYVLNEEVTPDIPELIEGVPVEVIISTNVIAS